MEKELFNDLVDAMKGIVEMQKEIKQKENEESYKQQMINVYAGQAMQGCISSGIMKYSLDYKKYNYSAVSKISFDLAEAMYEEYKKRYS